MMKKSIALALVLVLALVTLAACGAKKDAPAADPAAALVGTWEMDPLAAMQAADPSATAIPGMENAKIGFEFTADGKLNVTMMGQTVPAGDYKVNGNKITMDMGAMAGATTGTATDVEYKIDGNKLSLTAEGQTVELTKK